MSEAQFRDQIGDEFENQIINEEYKIWKKNVPFLYDMMITHELNWPSLTVQWLPCKEKATNNQDYEIHKLIIGTHAMEKEQNYLQIARVKLPSEETTTDISEYHQVNKDIGGFGLAADENKIEIETKIPHDGEINRARYMPQQYNIIASNTISGQIHIFDTNKYTNKQQTDISKPTLRLDSHTKEGYGQSWNLQKEGFLVTGANDGKICVWDIQKATQENQTLVPLIEYKYHDNAVQDVCWHKFSSDIFGAVSDDHTITLWDIRVKDKPTHQIQGHISEIYSIDFNPLNEDLFLTGSADKSIGFWNIKNTSQKLHEFINHADEVLKVEWSPFNVGMFASSSADRRIIVWDLSKIGDKSLSQDDLLDGPPEMLFIHGGHRQKVPDFSWNNDQQFVLASVEEENNFLQVWQMAYNIYQDDDYDQPKIVQSSN